LMMIQQKISEELNDKKIGKTYEVLIEEQIEDNVYTGRTQGDAEEIDSIVYVKSVDNLEVGEFVSVQINDAMEYDLMGDVLYELA
ncbi:TRAM domain-containing protein, partial [Clostridioides difficile]